MKQFFFIIALFVSLVSIGQTDEYYRTVDWKFYPDSIVQLTDSTYQLQAVPFDYNDPGAISRTVGNYVVDFVGHRYKVIDSTATKLTVLDAYQTGQAPQTEQIARCYRSVGDREAEFIGSVDYGPLDESSRWKLNGSDNELLWRAIKSAPSSNHADLTNLGWTVSNHTDGANKIAAFGASGEPITIDNKSARWNQHITNDLDTIIGNEIQSLVIDSTTTTYGISISGANRVSFLKGSVDLSGFVPYTGATANVDLGSYNLLANKLGIGVAVGTNEKIKARLNNATNYTALFENSGGGYGLKIAAGSGSDDIYLSMHDYSSGYEYFRFTGNGYFRTPNQSLDPSNVADYGFWYFKGNKPYAYINSVSYDLSSGSIWTDGGSYLYPTAYEHLYLTSDKGISWRNATSNPGAANNLWQIIPGTGKLNFNYGATPTTVAELLSTGSLALDGTVSIGGAYSFSLTDGTSGQVQRTDGLGNLTWYTPISLTSFSSTATGLTYTNTTGVFSLTSGYSIPTTSSQLLWDGAYTHSTTTTGSVHGSTTVGSNFFRLTNPSAITFPRINADNTVTALSAANFTTAIGAVPTSRTLTINGTSYDLSADRSWTISAGVSASGTPLDNQLSVWTNATTIEGDADLTFDGTNLTVGGYTVDDAVRVQSLSGTTVTMNTQSGMKGTITLTGNTTLTISNLQDGQEGLIEVTNGSSVYTLNINGSTGYTTEKVMGSKAAINANASTHTTVIYWRTGSTLYYGFLYDN